MAPSAARYVATVGMGLVTSGSELEGTEGRVTMLLWIIVIVLVLALLGSVPRWRHSRSWGWTPSGLIGLLLLLLIIAWLIGWI